MFRHSTWRRCTASQYRALHVHSVERLSSLAQMRVPTIDLAKMRGTPSERAALVESLRSCCHEGVGFFYLVGHGVELSLFHQVEGMAKQALRLPTSAKMQIDKRNSPHFRGYEQAFSEKTGGVPDAREQIDTWSELQPVAGGPTYRRLLGPNQFFDDSTLPGYKALTLQWHERLSGVSQRLLEVFSCALELPPDAIDKRFGEQRMSLIKYIRYPPTPDGGQGVGLHQDSAYLTLLLPGEEEGLECQLPSGDMLPVQRKEGAFVVNLGEALQLMTRNYFIATPHKVHTRRERFSVGFFYGPSLDTDLRPLALAPKFTEAVRASERHRIAGIMPQKEEIEEGVTGSLQGSARHETYGDLLWGYFSRAYPENMAVHYPKSQ
eukprot:TRINITY_DN91250_c0_g1_i1.p1 TRINITY_DN91250_c0_g1~~TRINITY_DN91250_c0_g1_i1.p1  ORF type:complete len:378 (-),score=60.16 TRINITY_DN91250_c0_g1_i1:81-1214(-)